jgi:hypothetical protein
MGYYGYILDQAGRAIFIANPSPLTHRWPMRCATAIKSNNGSGSFESLVRDSAVIPKMKNHKHNKLPRPKGRGIRRFASQPPSVAVS